MLIFVVYALKNVFQSTNLFANSEHIIVNKKLKRFFSEYSFILAKSFEFNLLMVSTVQFLS